MRDEEAFSATSTAWPPLWRIFCQIRCSFSFKLSTPSHITLIDHFGKLLILLSNTALSRRSVIETGMRLISFVFAAFAGHSIIPM